MGRCVDCNKKEGLFSKNDQYGLCKSCSSSINGHIRYHGLIKFWLSLSKIERRKCIENYDGVGIQSGGTSAGLIRGNLSSTSQTSAALLDVLGSNLISKKEYALAEKILEEAEKQADNPIDLHFCYNKQIELTYKLREEPSYLNRCVFYCIKDIELYPVFSKAWDERFGGDAYSLRIPSFERLAIIHEKQGQIEEAIKVCEAAIEYGLKDDTKGGFEGRLEKLKKKLK